ncbi:MAG: hypothetical protein HQM09_25210 [Candidatus Riflebacteria bacterium]|nr:hypothetical protein [Candidatus Riflebacteria bacterium]
MNISKHLHLLVAAVEGKFYALRRECIDENTRNDTVELEDPDSEKATHCVAFSLQT